MFLSETYTITDAVYYNSNTITSNTTLNQALPNGDFEISFKHKRTGNSGAFLDVSNGSRRSALCGCYGGNGVNGLRSYTGTGTYDFNEVQATSLATNTEVLIVWKHESTTNTYTANNDSKTLSNDSQTHSKLTSVTVGSGATVKELLIKPL